MSRYKSIFLDIDGTLVDYENKLPDSAKEAVQKARKNGHYVYICTGRSEAEVYDYIWRIGLDGMIGGNGSYVKVGNTVILNQHISSKEEKHVVNWLHARQLEFYLEADSGLYASEHFREISPAVLQEYSNRKGKTALITPDDIFPNMIYGADLYRDDVNKISFILNCYKDHLDAIAEFPELQAGTWGGAGETALFGDLGVKNISKAHAIDCLLKFTHASIEDTYAFGDAKIDIPMLAHCHTGIAMGNAGKECKEAADYITDDVNHDGLWNAFQHFHLIEQ